MLGKLMVNIVEDGNSCSERLNELVEINSNRVICNDEPYYPERVEYTDMVNLALVVNSHQAMKEALELIVNDLELHIDKDKYVSRMLYTAKKAITLANGEDKES